MTFKDLPEGQTHYENDGCGEPAHNPMTNNNPICKHGFHFGSAGAYCDCFSKPEESGDIAPIINKAGQSNLSVEKSPDSLEAILEEFREKFYEEVDPGVFTIVNSELEPFEDFLTQTYNLALAKGRKEFSIFKSKSKQELYEQGVNDGKSGLWDDVKEKLIRQSTIQEVIELIPDEAYMVRDKITGAIDLSEIKSKIKALGGEKE